MTPSGGFDGTPFSHMISGLKSPTTGMNIGFENLKLPTREITENKKPSLLSVNTSGIGSGPVSV